LKARRRKPYFFFTLATASSISRFLLFPAIGSFTFPCSSKFYVAVALCGEIPSLPVKPSQSSRSQWMESASCTLSLSVVFLALFLLPSAFWILPRFFIGAGVSLVSPRQKFFPDLSKLCLFAFSKSLHISALHCNAEFPLLPPRGIREASRRSSRMKPCFFF